MGALAAGKRSARRLGLYAFSRINPGNITMRHHYTGDPIRLHSFRHKGYWFHGRRREHLEMAAFSGLIRPGDQVIEVGGHIGYISLYFASLVGPHGRVHVFEPGTNNLPYLRGNVRSHDHVEVVEKALGREPAILPMHLEDLTGQNNSLVADFAGLVSNQRSAVRARVTQQLVEVATLDGHMGVTDLRPDFIKIDVEGFEWEVLQGAVDTLRSLKPVLMVEIQSHREEIGALLSDLGYRLYTPGGELIASFPDHTVNVFCMPPGREFPIMPASRKAV